MRKCPFDGCGAAIPPGMFSCRRHWYSLTQAQRNEIWAAYRSYQADKINIDELRRRQQVVLDATQGKGAAHGF